MPEGAGKKKVEPVQQVKGGGHLQTFEHARAAVVVSSYREEDAASLHKDSRLVDEVSLAQQSEDPALLKASEEDVKALSSHLASGRKAVVKTKTVVSVEGYWMPAGPLSIDVATAHKKFVVTDSVRGYVRSIARVLSGGTAPVLLEGPTSAGKTSLVMFMAGLTGHKCVRINNHEQTDVQEYLGQYVSDPISGQLVFEEGAIVKAAREGAWVVLDELNLAPPEVLEALNRLLDDNRELFIPETNTTVRPHPAFRLFATQNPAGGAYGGRKLLSRAFRNRFVEAFIDEIPAAELQTIVEARCAVPPSACALMVACFKELQNHRLHSAVFSGSQSAATVRDLLRWGARRPQAPEEVALEGWCLLGERLREEVDRVEVRKVIEKVVLKNKQTLTVDFESDPLVVDVRKRVQAALDANKPLPPGVPIDTLAWTRELCRMVALVRRAVDNKDPILLVGETGTGKTTVCQILAWLDQVERPDGRGELTIFNCHQHTETADLLGSLRPVRDRTVHLARALEASAALQAILSTSSVEDEESQKGLGELLSSVLAALEASNGGRPSIEDLEGILDLARSHVGKLASLARSQADAKSPFGVAEQIQSGGETADEEVGAPSKRMKGNDIDMEGREVLLEWASSLEKAVGQLARSLANACQLFEWVDGPLIRCMRGVGSPFLLDEVSLADDAVLERLNSVLEPSRTLYLSEKGNTAGAEEADAEVRGGDLFRILATMNPGGDFGKKELSPALRNRFVEVWVPAVDVASPQSRELVGRRLLAAHDWLAGPIVSFASWYNRFASPPLSVRDVVGLAAFVNAIAQKTQYPSLKAPALSGPVATLAHGLCLTFYDGLGLGGALKADAFLPSHQSNLAQEVLSKVDLSIRESYSQTFAQAPHGAVLRGVNPMMRFIHSLVVDSLSESLDARDDAVAIINQLGVDGLGWVAAARVAREPARLAALLPASAPAALREELAGRVVFGPFTFDGSKDGPNPKAALFAFDAPASACNAARVIRAVATNRPVLLEGPPGVGKTSLIQALADVAGCPLVRINVSEQTDIMDLLGGDLPRGDGFAWQNGPLLDAVQRGAWVLLDELNLAQQSVLEGLNALLDHRRQVYVPELDQTLECHPGFRVFAAQNPEEGGGGRKGLPKSFLNRFARIKLSRLEPTDLQIICRASVDSIAARADGPSDAGSFAERSVGFIAAVGVASERLHFEGSEGWEWNLRDGLRLVDLKTSLPSLDDLSVALTVARARLRTERDRRAFDWLAAVAFSSEGPMSHSGHMLKCFPELGLRAANVALGREDGATEGVHFSSVAAALDNDLVGVSDLHVTCGDIQAPRRLPFRPQLEGQTWELLGKERSRVARGLLAAVAAGWPSLLVGAPRSGKTRAVRWLADACGARLVEMPLSGSMDAGDLLGCFEQGDDTRFSAQIDADRTAVLAGVQAIAPSCLEDLAPSKWHRLPLGDLTRLVELTLAAAASSPDIPALWTRQLTERLRLLEESEAVLQARVEARARPDAPKGGFEWVDSALVVAAERGDWVVLRGAHVCPPSVLDRLNSLLEPRGFLRVQESGTERIVTPHPDFRLFITAHDQYCSSVSPALRNRSLEIFTTDATQATVPVAEIEANGPVVSSSIDLGLPECRSVVAEVAATLVETQSIEGFYDAALLTADLRRAAAKEATEDDMDLENDEGDEVNPLPALVKEHPLLEAAVSRCLQVRARLGAVVQSVGQLGTFLASLVSAGLEEALSDAANLAVLADAAALVGASNLPGASPEASDLLVRAFWLLTLLVCARPQLPLLAAHRGPSFAALSRAASSAAALFDLHQQAVAKAAACNETAPEELTPASIVAEAFLLALNSHTSGSASRDACFQVLVTLSVALAQRLSSPAVTSFVKAVQTARVVRPFPAGASEASQRAELSVLRALITSLSVTENSVRASVIASASLDFLMRAASPAEAPARLATLCSELAASGSTVDQAIGRVLSGPHGAKVGALLRFALTRAEHLVGACRQPLRVAFKRAQTLPSATARGQVLESLRALVTLLGAYLEPAAMAGLCLASQDPLCRADGVRISQVVFPSSEGCRLLRAALQFEDGQLSTAALPDLSIAAGGPRMLTAVLDSVAEALHTLSELPHTFEAEDSQAHVARVESTLALELIPQVLAVLRAMALCDPASPKGRLQLSQVAYELRALSRQTIITLHVAASPALPASLLDPLQRASARLRESMPCSPSEALADASAQAIQDQRALALVSPMRNLEALVAEEVLLSRGAIDAKDWWGVAELLALVRSVAAKPEGSSLLTSACHRVLKLVKRVAVVEENAGQTNVVFDVRRKTFQVEDEEFDRDRQVELERAKRFQVPQPSLLRLASAFRMAFSQNALLSFAGRVAAEAATLDLADRSPLEAVSRLSGWLDIVASLFRRAEQPPVELVEASAFLQSVRWQLEAGGLQSLEGGKELLNNCLMGACKALIGGASLVTSAANDEAQESLRRLLLEFDPASIPALSLLTATVGVKRVAKKKEEDANNGVTSSGPVDPDLLGGAVVRSALSVRAASEALQQPTRSFLESEEALREFTHLFCLSEQPLVNQKDPLAPANPRPADSQLLAALLAYVLDKAVTPGLSCLPAVQEQLRSTIRSLTHSLALGGVPSAISEARGNLVSVLSSCGIHSLAPLESGLFAGLLVGACAQTEEGKPLGDRGAAATRALLWVLVSLWIQRAAVDQALSKLRLEVELRARLVTEQAAVDHSSLALNVTLASEALINDRTRKETLAHTPAQASLAEWQRAVKGLEDIRGRLVLRPPESLERSSGEALEGVLPLFQEVLGRIRPAAGSVEAAQLSAGLEVIASTLADQLQAFAQGSAEPARVARAIPVLSRFDVLAGMPLERGLKEALGLVTIQARGFDVSLKVESTTCANLTAVCTALAARLSRTVRLEFNDVIAPVLLSASALAHGLARASEAWSMSDFPPAALFPVKFGEDEADDTHVPVVEEALTTLRWAAAGAVAGGKLNEAEMETVRRTLRGLAVRLERALKRKQEEEQRKLASYLVDFDDEPKGAGQDSDESGAEDDFDPNSGGAKKKRAELKPYDEKHAADIHELFPTGATLDPKRKSAAEQQDEDSAPVSGKKRTAEEEAEEQRVREDRRVDEAVEEVCDLLELASLGATRISSLPVAHHSADDQEQSRNLCRRAMVSTLERELQDFAADLEGVSAVRDLDLRVEPLAWAALQLAEQEASSRGLSLQEQQLKALQGELLLDVEGGVVGMKAPERSKMTVDEEALEENPLEIGETRAALTPEERREREEARAIKEGSEEISEAEARRLVAVERARKVKFSALLRRQKRGTREVNSDAATSFYSASNPALCVAAWPAVSAVLERVKELLKEYPDNVQLDALAEVCIRFGAMPATESPPAMLLANLELILDRASAWEVNAAKHVSLREQLDLIKHNIVTLRARQLQEWRLLRDFRERHFARKAQSWLGFLIMLVAQAAPDRPIHTEAQLEDLEDSELRALEEEHEEKLRNPLSSNDRRQLASALLTFVRSGPIGEFHARLQLLHTVGAMFASSLRKRERDAARHMLSIAYYAEVWEPAVAFALGTARAALTKEVVGLSKLARWDLSQYEALRASVHRSHAQLRNAVRRFDLFLSETCDNHIANQLSEIPALRLPSPPALHAQKKSRKGLPQQSEERSALFADCLANLEAENQALVKQVLGYVEEDRVLPEAATAAAGLPGLSVRRLLAQLQSVALSHALPRIRGVASQAPVFLCQSVIEGVTEALAEVPALDGNGKLRLIRDYSRSLSDLAFKPLPWHQTLVVLADTAESLHLAGSPFDSRTVFRAPCEHLTDSLHRAEAAVNAGDEAFVPLLHVALKLTTMQPHQDIYAMHKNLVGQAGALLQAAITHRAGSMATAMRLTDVAAAATAILSEASCNVKVSLVEAILASVEALRDGAVQALSLLPEDAQGWKGVKGLGDPKALVALLETSRSGLESLRARADGMLKLLLESSESRLVAANPSEATIRVREHSFVRSLYGHAKSLHQLADKFASELRTGAEGAACPLPAAVSLSVTQHLPAQVLDTCAVLLRSVEAKPAVEAVTSSQEALLMKQALLLVQAVVRAPRSSIYAMTEDEAKALELDELADGETIDLCRPTESAIHATLAAMIELLPGCLGQMPARSSGASVAWPFVLTALRVASVANVSEASLFEGVAKLGLCICKTVSLLLERGLCKPSQRQQQDTTRGEDEWNEGTGLGEGQGEKDITDEIEDEQQFDGLRGEKEEKPREKQEEADGPDQAMEVDEMDFDAPLENRRPDKKEDDKLDDEERKEQEENMDRHEGDVDLDDGGQLDEKLWNPDEHDKPEDDKNDSKDKKKKEEDIRATGGEDAGEEELQGKEDGAEDDKDDKPSKDDKRKEKQKPQQQQPQDEDGDSQESPEDDQGDDAAGSAGEEEEGEEEDDPRDEEGQEGTRHDVNLPEPQRQNGQDEEDDIDLDGFNDDEEGESPEEQKGEEEDEAMEGEQPDRFGDGQEPDKPAEQPDDVGDHSTEDVPQEAAGEDEDMDGAEEKEQDIQEDETDENSEERQPPEDGEGNNDPAQDPAAEQQPEPQPEEGEAVGHGTDAPEEDPASEEKEEEDKDSQQAASADVQATQSGQANTKLQDAQQPDAQQAQSATPDAAQQTGGQTSSAQQEGAAQDASRFDQQQQKPSAAQRSKPAPNPLKATEAELEQWLDRVQLQDDQQAEDEATSGSNNSKPDEPLPSQAQAQQGGEGDRLALAEASAANEEDLDAKQREPAEDEEMRGPEEAAGDEKSPEEEDKEDEKDAQKGSSNLNPSAEPPKEDAKAPQAVKPKDTSLPPLEQGEEDSDAEDRSGVLAGEDATLFDAPADEEEEEESDIEEESEDEDEEARLEAEERYRFIASEAAAPAAALAEQLRLILEPSQRGRLQGDFRTGKRISMRKVVAFIASNFRRDKIWLRRTRPSKRRFDVLLALDDSTSMREHGASTLALQALATVSQAMDKLEVGRVGLLKFGGEKPKLLAGLGEGASAARVAKAAGGLQFASQGKDSHNEALPEALRLALATFEKEAQPDRQRLLMVVTDGRFNKQAVREWVGRCGARGVIPVLIIVDGHGGRSIYDVKTPLVDPATGKLKGMASYLDDLPFGFYAVANGADVLPRVVGETLRQWVAISQK